jgi:hypothetical protein
MPWAAITLVALAGAIFCFGVFGAVVRRPRPLSETPAHRAPLPADRNVVYFDIRRAARHH